MERRAFGRTGLTTSVLGFGGGHIGGGEMSDDEATRLVHAALDLGVTLFDTARGYGLSEERLGRALEGRRADVVLSTKGGYGVEGVPDWTGPAITRGIEDALGRLRTDHLDVFHLHSCPRDVALRGDIQRALLDARDAGKIRVAAYSGENEDLAAALDSGAFGSVQLSINVCDQQAADALVPFAAERGHGIIAKRPLANAPWRHETLPEGEYVETYWRRFRVMELHRWEGDWGDRALRFAAFTPGVSTVIVGTRSLAHLTAAAASLGRGALPAEETHALTVAFRTHGQTWRGEI
jgi:aryl-alcohol dehydrogenase-like predicted oxidoreductase